MAGLALTPAPVGLRIGLTGGIGCGKSTVAQMLVDLGACLIDTDAIAHALTGPQGAAMHDIGRVFGPQMVGADGALDRARMRELAFSQPQALAQLQAILHPLILEQALQQAQAARAKAPERMLVFDVPLLVTQDGQVSAFWRQQVDRILVVDASVDRQIQRVIKRSGWTQEAVERVLQRQASRQARLAAADDVLHNDSESLDVLRAQVQSLWARWLGLAAPA